MLFRLLRFVVRFSAKKERTEEIDGGMMIERECFVYSSRRVKMNEKHEEGEI